VLVPIATLSLAGFTTIWRAGRSHFV